MNIEEITNKIKALPYKGKRRIVALAGPPASGKTTLAQRLADALDHAQMVPMDGFHLDNRLLEQRGLSTRKGTPETFDAAGFYHLITRLAQEEDVIFPHFDRALDKSIAGAGHVGADTGTVIVEGNYLLLDQPIWRNLHPLWDFSISLNVPEAVLEERLMERWRSHGFDHQSARAKVQNNDMPNATFVASHSLPADLTIAA